MPRIAFYSHDTMGLGHLSRCVKLARALSSLPGELEGVFITGSPWTHLFSPPSDFRFVELPPVKKSGRWTYCSRVQGVDLKTVLRERQVRILRALQELQPDLLVVDNVPDGLLGEMLPALERFRDSTKVVLALREILDRTDKIAEEWNERGATEAAAYLYDEIWLFGDDSDARELVDGGPLAKTSATLVACGRLGACEDEPNGPGDGSSRPRRHPTPGGSRRPLVTLTGGGGADALPMVQTYMNALTLYRPRVDSHIILGPDFPMERFSSMEAQNDSAVRSDSFVPQLSEILRASDVVVSMAGYNTVSEILASGCRAVLVPRSGPREEQILRAERLERAGRASVVYPQDLDPRTLWEAITAALDTPVPSPERLQGGTVAASRAAKLLSCDNGKGARQWNA